MLSKYETIVVGGGASGMAAAISSAEHGRKTLLLEKSGRTGRKILASGNGRCNILNDGKPRYYGESRFAEEVLKNCTIGDVERFFRRYGLMLRREKEHRIYPMTMQAASVYNALQYAMKINGVTVVTDQRIEGIDPQDGRFRCKTEQGDEYAAERLIICTGGAAQQKLGGSCDGYRYLQAMGHRMEPVFPSLAPVVTDRRSISGLAGIRTQGRVSLKDGEKVLHREEGEILFTEYGISGICVMQCSRFISGPGLHFEIDLLSGAFRTPGEAYAELARRRETFAGFSPVALLEGIVMPKVAYAVMKQAGLPLRGESAGEVTDPMIEKIVQAAYQYRLEIMKTKGFDDAQVTAGGILCSEFDAETMESRLVKGLHAAGEVLNVDGDCGGFNLMFAFASGLIAGGFRRGEPGDLQ